MQKIKLTILTPTYNREHLLPRVFASLQTQTVKDFEWLVIDDGSTDNTEEYMQSLPMVDFSVRYYRKENGGKHTALNYSHRYIRGESVLILDSDDYLTPETVETILNDWQKYAGMSNVAVLSYEKGEKNGKIISERADMPDYYLSDDIHFRVNHCVHGDRAEVVRTEVFKNFSLPTHNNEKFMSEGWLWNNIAKRYQTVYIQKVIYICEYLDMGLTRSGRILRMHSPLNMMEACKSFFYSEVCLKIQLKEMLLFCVYGLCSKLPVYKWVINSGRPIQTALILPLGWVLFKYWKSRYSF
ncbi:MAG: glycosyltransferase family A protein [Selenomonadaceae bacterium]|nr:glycosyltransferase family A protein [Selenomonadaceae bacterium]